MTFNSILNHTNNYINKLRKLADEDDEEEENEDKDGGRHEKDGPPEATPIEVIGMGCAMVSVVASIVMTVYTMYSFVYY